MPRWNGLLMSTGLNVVGYKQVPGLLLRSLNLLAMLRVPFGLPSAGRLSPRFDKTLPKA
jgi:hypothetical protein